ncbi:imidazole glycerol phosphate synthase subunit HisH [Thomasclavelia cocleata]|jgi:glutamine amidotransferase|uniref:imidazole glycerol phosphate synthase subunit HisH n=1 Tax=Thomasclavelia cocleata TaxID=69824 RepID=UPI00242E1C09|nr:imidazole glycerol phosphate synthase subunit HisH [Thomasclavelia cocleata]MCI9630010.1 imidazole glycerol phosphate synthase subunit HisH [Thomasclavelia cocleata]
MVVIIDYNIGNLSSVTSALKRVGIEAVITRDKELIRQARAIVLPGVGAFPVAMNNLKKYDLIGVLNECKNAGIPILGICLGMQILFEKGYEVEETDGLGFLNGEVKFMDIDEKIPHMGWNQLHFNQIHPILKNIRENDDVYFVHSFMAECPNEQLVAYSDYGDTKVTAIAVKDNIIGCQFHPEKSGAVGTQILKAFKEMIEC